MGKKAWITFAIICVVLVILVLVAMLVLVPQVKSSGVTVDAYQKIAKQEYTFNDSNTDSLKKEYTVTTSKVEKGLKTDKYEEGNINPFTPPSEVTIYNEPTLKNEGSSNPLTPESK